MWHDAQQASLEAFHCDPGAEGERKSMWYLMLTGLAKSSGQVRMLFERIFCCCHCGGAWCEWRLESRAGFFCQGILSVRIKPEAPKLQHFVKGSMTCSAAPEIS